MYAIKIVAPADNRGNPRRGWKLFTDSGIFTAFVDEGFRGDKYLGHLFPGTVILDQIKVSATEYNRAVREDVAPGSLMPRGKVA